MISDKRIATKFLLVVLFCVFVSGDDAAQVRCIEREREALLRFKNGLIDDDGILSSWRSGECCQWYGVECSNTTGHVITLQLYDEYLRGDDAQVRCIEREREALLSFKNGLIDDYDHLSSWGSDECCQWYGVECSNTTGHVITLQVNGLRGKIGSSLVELHHLNYLDLSWNDFGGIPIPEFIGSIKQLQHLTLRSCNFSGIIPPQLGNLTNLHSLDLSGNDFGGIPIPEFIGSIKQLQHLSLWNSNFSGIVPPQIGNLTNLHSLDLSWNDFGGIPIPEFIGSIKQLQYLSLSYSNFSGIVPPQIGNRTNLHALDLRGNDFVGIPPQLGNLTNLELLDLADNQLNGSMPDLRAFSSLTQLYLQGNNFTGSIPPSIGQLSKLQLLDLSYNSLQGSVTESHFIKLDKLEMLDLSFNSLILDIAPDWSPPFQLSGIYLAGCNAGPSFPKWIRTQRKSFLDLSGAKITNEAPNLSSTSFVSLDLSNNQFSGPIPLFPACASYIYLSGNMFSGSISSICKTHYDQLRIFDLSNNQLEGEVPNCWEKIPNLEYLNLANNSFSGEIPRSFGNLKDLGSLQMHGNNISGDLRNLRLCQRLILIDVGGNELRGEIPTWIGHMYDLRILNFRGNKLHGSIPPQICNLTNIHVLDFSINNLSSIIPDCFNNFTLLATNTTDLYLFFSSGYYFDTRNEKKQYQHSSFQWKGQESQYRENLGLLKLIDFSSNRLTGNIPKSFSNMRELNSFNLSRNSLTGYIIPDIGKMKMLDSLDLSHNQLSGKIPTSLKNIYTLGVLDLSNNKLSGRIPTSTQLQSFNASAYARNDGLCGDPLAKCPGDRLIPSTTDPGDNMNEKDGSSLSFMQEVGISMGFGFIFGFWGVVGSLILKKSWRIAFFNLMDAAGDWFYVRTAVFVSKWRRS